MVAASKTPRKVAGQSSLPWAKQSAKSQAKAADTEDLSKSRTIVVPKTVIFKACASSGEFMLLKTSNVRAVSTGSTVYIVPRDADHDNDCDADQGHIKGSANKVCSVIATCRFVGNVKMSEENIKSFFGLHGVPSHESAAMLNAGNVIGWKFEQISMLSRPLWIVSCPKKD